MDGHESDAWPVYDGTPYDVPDDHAAAVQDATDGDLASYIASHSVVLPEPGFRGPVIHMPARRIDGSEPTGDEHYVIVLPHVTAHDVFFGVHLSDTDRIWSFLKAELERAKIPLESAVITASCRFHTTAEVKTYAQKHYARNAPYVIEDLERYAKRGALLLGAPIVKQLCGVTLATVRGQVFWYRSPKRRQLIPMVATVSPLLFAKGYENIVLFRNDLQRFSKLVNRSSLAGAVVAPADVSRPAYGYVTTYEGLKAVLESLPSGPVRIACDTEYGNDVARDEYTYPLTVQLSWAPNQAVCCVFRGFGDPPPVERLDGPRESLGSNPGDRVMSLADEQRCWELLQRVFLDQRVVFVGHHVRADVDQFYRAGYPIDRVIRRSLDTMLMHYVLYGDSVDHGLDALVQQYLPDVGPYWAGIECWLNEHGRSSSLRFGYRNIPTALLVPYALRDADVTLALANILYNELQRHPTLERLYWNYTMPTALHLLDVERHGILVDERLRMEMREYYDPLRKRCMERMRESLAWPEFQPSSKVHVAYALFGTCVYKGVDGARAIAPQTARIRPYRPLYNTDKYPKPWDAIVAAGEEAQHTPSTEFETIKALSLAYPDDAFLLDLMHYSVLSKCISAYLMPQTLNEFGVPEGGSGFHENVYADGRVRTHLSQLTATGRYTSSRANLQVNPKKQEAALFAACVYATHRISVQEYRQRVGLPPDDPRHVEPVRQYKFKSCFIAPPGRVLVEADFKNAELCVWAYLSNDPNLIALVRSGRDLHSEVACVALHLPLKDRMDDAIAALEAGDASLYKAWNADVKKQYEAERTAAKAVNFGIMYGRGAAALSRALTSEGSPMSVDVCQSIIDSFAARFPVAWKWLQDGADFAVQHGYIENPFGARRYFPEAWKLPKSEQASIRRQAMNARIQGTVAYLLSQAGILLYHMRYENPKTSWIDFQVLLPIHDAFLCEVRQEHVEPFIKLLKFCMSDANAIPGCPYVLDIDVHVMKSWGDV